MPPILIEKTCLFDAAAIDFRTLHTTRKFITLVLTASVKAELMAVLTFGASVVAAHVPRCEVQAVCHCAMLIRQTHLHTLCYITKVANPQLSFCFAVTYHTLYLLWLFCFTLQIYDIFLNWPNKNRIIFNL